VASVRDHLLLATSAQLVGLARQLLDLAVRHVSVREQFGRPLGALQAVQHRLADVAVGIEFADPVVARAACSLAAGAPSAGRDVAMAKVFASEAAERAAYAGLQVHGAIGYTQEHDLHLYALRAWALALARGDARRHRQRVADDLLGASPASRFPAS
jgi:alkylation response protein AidB-like acyl-CoA dehydrogenase